MQKTRWQYKFITHNGENDRVAEKLSAERSTLDKKLILMAIDNVIDKWAWANGPKGYLYD